MYEITEADKRKIRDVATRAKRVISDRNAEGKVGLSISSQAWSRGEIKPVVVTDIPHVLSPAEAKEIGWTLYRLGVYGTELVTDNDHEIDDGDYFRN